MGVFSPGALEQGKQEGAGAEGVRNRSRRGSKGSRSGRRLIRDINMKISRRRRSDQDQDQRDYKNSRICMNKSKRNINRVNIEHRLKEPDQGI